MTFSVIGFKGSPAAMAPSPYPGGPRSWLNQTGNSWRSSRDVSYSWQSIMLNLDIQENVPDVEELAGPGGFSDLDMLMFGHPRAQLTSAQAASHLALWAVLKSPLLISTDVTALTTRELAMLTSKHMLAVNQDALGVQARRVTPSAHYAAGGAVFLATTSGSYGTPPSQNWVQQAPEGAGGKIHGSGSVQLKNEGSGMCLGVWGGR